jgi:hypothetical protein
MYMVRRLILGPTIVFLYSYPGIQVMVQLIFSIAMMSYLVTKCHFTSKVTYATELANESTLFLLTLHLVPLSSDPLGDGDLRPILGSLMVHAVFVCIGLNLVAFSISLAGDLYKALKRFLTWVRSFLNRDKVVKLRKMVDEVDMHHQRRRQQQRMVRVQQSPRDVSMLMAEAEVSKGGDDQSFF